MGGKAVSFSNESQNVKEWLRTSTDTTRFLTCPALYRVGSSRRGRGCTARGRKCITRNLEIRRSELDLLDFGEGNGKEGKKSLVVARRLVNRPVRDWNLLEIDELLERMDETEIAKLD